MDFVQHPTNNHIFGKPRDWDETTQGRCGALPVTMTEFVGNPAIKSYWKPTEEEIEALKNGAYVALYIIGQGMPPVAMQIEK